MSDAANAVDVAAAQPSTLAMLAAARSLRELLPEGRPRRQIDSMIRAGADMLKELPDTSPTGRQRLEAASKRFVDATRAAMEVFAVA